MSFGTETSFHEANDVEHQMLYFAIFSVLVTFDVMCMFELYSIIFIAINLIEFMVVNMKYDMVGGISRRNNGGSFSVCMDIRIQYGGIITIYTQV